MKKWLALLLVFALCVSLAGCKASEASAAQSAASSPNQSAGTSASQSTAASTANSDLELLEDLGDIEVEEELFDVEVTLPADFVGDATQEQLDAQVQEYGFHSATLNEDGTATYVMSKKQHQQYMQELAQSINDSLNEMVGSEDTPNITAIEANDNFTSFTVTTTSTELGLTESMSVLGFSMYGGLYGIFSGETPENIHVDFVNADTQEVIESFDSSEMEG